MDEKEGTMASHRPSILQVAWRWRIQIDRDHLWKSPGEEGIQIQTFHDLHRE